MNEIFYLMKKIMFRSQDILIFVVLVNQETPKSVTSSYTSLSHMRRYTFDCFFRIYGGIKINFN